jgi:hypothetical protein
LLQPVWIHFHLAEDVYEGRVDLRTGYQWS